MNRPCPGSIGNAGQEPLQVRNQLEKNWGIRMVRKGSDSPERVNFS